MKKALGLFLLIVLAWLPVAQAAQWQQIYSDVYQTVFVDLQSIQQNDAGSYIFWSKFIAKPTRPEALMINGQEVTMVKQVYLISCQPKAVVMGEQNYYGEDGFITKTYGSGSAHPIDPGPVEMMYRKLCLKEKIGVPVSSSPRRKPGSSTRR